MTQKEKREYLIQELLSEFPPYRDMKIPDSEEEQKGLLRSLMNVRPPRPAKEEFLRIQDEYLQEETAEKGITDSELLPPSSLDGRLVLWRGDITTLKIDAIVNAANSALRGCFVPCHSCIDNIIHTNAGVQLRLDCDTIMNEQGYEEPTGQAKITPAYNLPSRYVIHTVGPIVSGELTKKALPAAGRLLPFLPWTGRGKWTEKYRFLLYLHRRVSFSTTESGGDRGEDRAGISETRYIHRTSRV